RRDVAVGHRGEWRDAPRLRDERALGHRLSNPILRQVGRPEIAESVARRMESEGKTMRRRNLIGLALLLTVTFAPGGALAAPAGRPSVIATINVGIAPNGVAVDSTTHTIYVVNGGDGSSGSSTVSVIDGATNALITTIHDVNFFNSAGAAID